MASVLGSLRVRLSVETEDFRKGLQSARQKLTTLDRGLKRFGKQMLPLSGAIGGVGAALTAATVKAADFADMIDKTAIRSGLSRATLQELQFTSDQLGVSFEGTVKVLEAFTRRIPQIESGTGSAAEAFTALGVQLRGPDGQLRSMSALFPEIVSGLGRIQNETERNALATQLFGRRAFEIVPLLEAGGEQIARLNAQAREMGLVMGDEAIADLVAWKDQVAGTKMQLAAVTREIATAFLPVIRKLTEAFQKHAVPVLRRFAEFLKGISPTVAIATGAVAGMIAAVGPLALTISGIIKGAGLLKAAFLALTGPVGLTVAAVGALTFAGATLYRNWDVVKLRLTLVWTAIKAAVFDSVDAILGALEKLTGWIPKVGDKVRELRRNFDEWADRSLANSNDAILRLEREIADNFKPTVTTATDTVTEFGNAMDRTAEQARSLANAVAQLNPRIDLQQSIKPATPLPKRVSRMTGKATPEPINREWNLIPLANAANAVLSGDARQIGSTLGGMAGSLLPVPGLGMITATLGGFIGGLFDRDKEQKRQTAALQRIDQNTRQTAQVLELQRRMTDAARGAVNVPARFTIPQYSPRGQVAVTVYQENHFSVPDEQVARVVRDTMQEDLGTVLQDAVRRMGVAV